MTTATIERVDLLQGLDFDPPCEHSQHDLRPDSHHGRAWALVQLLECCPCQDGGMTLYLCKRVWDDPRPVYCHRCNAGPFAREQVWRFLGLVRP